MVAVTLISDYELHDCSSDCVRKRVGMYRKKIKTKRIAAEMSKRSDTSSSPQWRREWVKVRGLWHIAGLDGEVGCMYHTRADLMRLQAVQHTWPTNGRICNNCAKLVKS